MKTLDMSAMMKIARIVAVLNNIEDMKLSMDGYGVNNEDLRMRVLRRKTKRSIPY